LAFDLLFGEARDRRHQLLTLCDGVGTGQTELFVKNLIAVLYEISRGKSAIGIGDRQVAGFEEPLVFRHR